MPRRVARNAARALGQTRAGGPISQAIPDLLRALDRMGTDPGLREARQEPLETWGAPAKAVEPLARRSEGWPCWARRRSAGISSSGGAL